MAICTAASNTPIPALTGARHLWKTRRTNHCVGHFLLKRSRLLRERSLPVRPLLSHLLFFVFKCAALHAYSGRLVDLGRKTDRTCAHQSSGRQRVVWWRSTSCPNRRTFPDREWRLFAVHTTAHSNFVWSKHACVASPQRQSCSCVIIARRCCSCITISYHLLLQELALCHYSNLFPTLCALMRRRQVGEKYTLLLCAVRSLLWPRKHLKGL